MLQPVFYALLKLLFSVRFLFRVGSFCGVRSTAGAVAGAAEFAFALFGVAVVLCVRIAVLCGIPKLFGTRCPFLCKVYAFIAKLINILFIQKVRGMRSALLYYFA